MTREEAINKVRQMSLPKETMEILQALAPELRESEDERIRKKLHEVICRSINDPNLPYAERDYVSRLVLPYVENLEKQKEQKPVEIHIDNPNIQKVDPDVEITTCGSSADGKELLYVSNKSYDIGFRDGVASVKSAEWSEQDDAFRELLICILKAEHPNGIFSMSTKQISALKCDVMPVNRIIDWLKSLSPQPKQEWSEEDDSMWADVLESFDALKDYVKDNPIISNGAAKEMVGEIDSQIEWLRETITRINYHWKPSDQ